MRDYANLPMLSVNFLLFVDALNIWTRLKLCAAPSIRNLKLIPTQIILCINENFVFYVVKKLIHIHNNFELRILNLFLVSDFIKQQFRNHILILVSNR